MPAKCGPCDKRWARLQGSNDGCMRVKRWNSVWCSIPLINRSIRVYSSLPSQCRDEFFSYWLYHSMLTRTGRPSAPSNQYGLIMPLRPDTHQTVIFSTLSGWYWWPLGWTLPRHWKNEVQEIRIVFHSLTDGLSKDTALKLICIDMIVVKSASSTQAGDDLRALYPQLDS